MKFVHGFSFCNIFNLAFIVPAVTWGKELNLILNICLIHTLITVFGGEEVYGDRLKSAEYFS